MNDADTRRFESFLRGQDFGRLQATRIPAASFAADLFTRLSRIITDIETQSAAQSSGLRAAQQSTTSKASARDELLIDLRAIARTARGMAVTIPGLDDKFRIPQGAKDQDLLSFARAVLAEATLLKDQFIKFGMDADFLTDLNDDTKIFEQAVTSQIQGTETHVAASAAIDSLIDEGINTMRELDPVVRNIFADDPAALAQWFSARHVERAPKKKKPITSPPTP